MCVSLPMAPHSAFPGLVSWAYLPCSSAQVVFKWHWCDWKSTHPAVNRHTTGQKAWPSYWLLFVISRAQMGLRCDLLAVSTSTHGKTHHFHGSSPPLISMHHSNVIICDSGIKNYLKWQVIQLAVFCRVGQLKDIV